MDFLYTAEETSVHKIPEESCGGGFFRENLFS